MQFYIILLSSHIQFKGQKQNFNLGLEINWELVFMDEEWGDMFPVHPFTPICMIFFHRTESAHVGTYQCLGVHL